VIPEKEGYRPFKALATTTNAPTSRAQGASWFRAPDGTTKNFASDVSKLIRLIVITKWRNKLGVNFWNPDHQDKVDALLNDPEWRWPHTDNSVRL
jgi:hypothetical protein